MHLTPIGSVAILTTEQLAAIGSVAVESTYCELEVEQWIWVLAGLEPERGIHFTHGIQLQNRLDMLGQLAKERLSNQEDKVEMAALISDLKIANNDRNVVIHGMWFSAVERRKLISDGIASHPPATAFKRRLRSDPLELSASAVSEVAQRIANLTFTLSRMDSLFAVQLEQETSRRKSLGLPPPLAPRQSQEPSSATPPPPPESSSA